MSPEQSRERTEGFVDLSIGLGRYASATFERMASARRFLGTSVLPSSHDTPTEELERRTLGTIWGVPHGLLAEVVR
ncbi:MAG: hypothetical protein ABS36_06400 [Acidobacteria bacterium SCN 69-37]|nr:MAG: hypothetical protein ABS36_06400 [Acidobacteria bacterium SCN 69-37]